MRKNIIVTAIGGDIAQSIIKCLKDTDYKVRIVGCDIDRYAAGRSDVSGFLIAPKAVEKDRYFNFIKKAVKKYSIEYIYPASDQEIIFFNRYRNYFEEKGIKLFINSPYIIDTFLDKYKTVDFLRRNNLPYPLTFLAKKYKNQLSYPFILKPRKERGSKGVIKINNVEESRFYRKAVPGAIVQEYLGGENEEYTTGLFSDGKNVYSVSFRRKIGFGGVSKLANLLAHNKIAGIAKKIAQSCNLIGSINIQWRMRKRKPVVFEINPRFSSTVYLRHYFGFQDVKWWMDVAEKKAIRCKLRYRKGIGVRRLSEAFFECG